jgi:hypothetical protein
MAIMGGWKTSLSLPGLEAAIGLVDHIEPATAAHDAISPMPSAQGTKRVSDLHRIRLPAEP